MTPNCYNRPPFVDTVVVQAGWHVVNMMGIQTRMPAMKVIPWPFDQVCQIALSGETIRLGFDCVGCKWEPSV